MKKIKLTEKISERYDMARALLCCFVIALIAIHLNGSRSAINSALSGLTQTINKQHLMLCDTKTGFNSALMLAVI